MQATLDQVIDSRIGREGCEEGEEPCQRCFQHRAIEESRVEEGSIDGSIGAGSSMGSSVMEIGEESWLDRVIDSQIRREPYGEGGEGCQRCFQ